MKEEFSEELVSWAEEVITECKPIAENYHLDYYAFQKPCNLNYKYLILALNPYSKDSFPSQKVETIIPSTLTVNGFLNGNSAWNDYKSNWKIVKQLMKMKIIDDLQLEFNYMNFVYFPSRKFSDLKNIKEEDLIEKCKNLTLKFIDILKPAKIILLGTSSGSDQFAIDGKTLLIGNGNKRLVVKGSIGTYEVLAIPHPSWLSDVEIANIDLSLRDENRPGRVMDNELIAKTEGISRDQIDASLEILNPDTLNIKYTDIYVKGLGSDEILLRINYQKKVLGLRSSRKNNFYDLDYAKFYRKFFKKVVEENNNSWILQRKFPSHFFTDGKEIVDEIFALVDAIKCYKQ